MSTENYIYKINHFKFDPATLELHSKDQTVTLQNKVAKVLIILLEANGDLISKADIIKKVWTNTIVTENSLNKTISELRKAFNDSRTHPKYIVTVPKKGYKLIAPITKRDKTSSSIKIVKSRKAITVFSSFLLLSALFISLYYTKTPSKSILSNNGEIVASIKRVNQQYILYTEDLINDITIKIDSFKEPESLALNWSKDDRQIIYNTTQDTDEFYSLSVYDINSSSKSYIKFPKDESKSLKHLNLKNTTLLEHDKIERTNNKVHYINLIKGDTIKVLLKGKLINDFKW